MQEFLDLDHQIWTLGEAFQDPLGTAWNGGALPSASASASVPVSVSSSSLHSSSATAALAATVVSAAISAAGARAGVEVDRKKERRMVPFLSKEVWLDDHSPGTCPTRRLSMRHVLYVLLYHVLSVLHILHVPACPNQCPDARRPPTPFPPSSYSSSYSPAPQERSRCTLSGTLARRGRASASRLFKQCCSRGLTAR